MGLNPLPPRDPSVPPGYTRVGSLLVTERKLPPPPALVSLLDGDPVERDLAYCRELYAHDSITLAEHARRVELILSGRRAEAIPERGADDEGLEPLDTEEQRF